MIQYSSELLKPSLNWICYANERIAIRPKENKRINLGFGVDKDINGLIIGLIDKCVCGVQFISKNKDLFFYAYNPTTVTIYIEQFDPIARLFITGDTNEQIKL